MDLIEELPSAPKVHTELFYLCKEKASDRTVIVDKYDEVGMRDYYDVIGSRLVTLKEGQFEEGSNPNEERKVFDGYVFLYHNELTDELIASSDRTIDLADSMECIGSIPVVIRED